MIVALARKTGHRTLALGHHWRDIGGRRPASGRLKAREEHPLTYSALALAFQRTAELTIRGGGKPYSNMALMPTERMGPPPGASPPMRMTASWSGSKRTDRIQVCGARSAPNGELPSDPPQTGTVRRRSCGSPCRRSSSLREPDRRRRVRRTAFPLRTKNRQQTKNNYLTGKAPYKFESPFLQRRVRCEP